MPVFEYNEESMSDSLNRTLLDLLILSLMIIILFALAFVSFLRYDLRYLQ